ncbi:potassium transporter [Marivirga lumbricoides]|uniref:Potassium transporter n=1 Tax=Marivirga lumbricoides TaxID=1046115 RepID=A0A2T4DR15_9BACT|nr:potassium transporter [Marivirga lumbricoides]
MESSFLQTAVILLGTALIFVPIAKKAGIGSVLGYLLGGIIIGPFILGLIGNEGEDIMHAAEFGVVMMLFLIGLELNPESFWKMRKSILGMGLSQLIGSSALIFALFYFILGKAFNTSVAVSLSLAMSSTAIVLQTLKEKSLTNTHAGKSSFSVLLLQDIAVIPILAIIPLLATNAITSMDSKHSIIADLDPHFSTLIILAVVAFIYILGRFLINPFLHYIAKVRMRELFTASALFIVIGVAWLMEQVGISAALGTFMAGVLLANSEFRHELESDIEPFKGVLLGLFFTAVGSTINFDLIFADPVAVFSFVLLIMLIKAVVLFTIGKIFNIQLDQNLLFSLLLCQVGEFAFVLLASTRQLEIIDKETLDFLMAVTTISMILSPLFLYINERFIDPKLGVKQAESRPADDVEGKESVIIAGFGHFGSTIGRFLRANGVSATILDNDSEQVDLLRKMGFKVFYGDATRVDLLEAAGASKAKILISAIDSPERNYQLVDEVKKHFPHLQLFMRAKNRMDAYEFIELGVNDVYRESLHTSVNLGIDVLHALGQRKYTASRKAAEFIHYDEKALNKLGKFRHEKTGYVESVRNEIEIQERLLAEDAKFLDQREDAAWDSSKRRS